MTWTAPLTAVASTAFTAAQFNTHVRDNLLETAPAQATTGGRIFVAVGANSIAERATETAIVNTSETTASTSYADLATVGPSVTVTTGTKAIVMIGVQMSNDTAATSANNASVAVSGASSQAGSDDRSVRFESVGANDQGRLGLAYLHTGLSSGSNTFKLQYRVSSGTGTFLNRSISVIGL